jgi:hypothetical protein
MAQHALVENPVVCRKALARAAGSAVERKNSAGGALEMRGSLYKLGKKRGCTRFAAVPLKKYLSTGYIRQCAMGCAVALSNAIFTYH